MFIKVKLVNFHLMFSTVILHYFEFANLTLFFNLQINK